MSFLVASEIDSFQQTLRALLADKYPIASVRRRIESSPSPTPFALQHEPIWNELVTQGVFMAPVSEAQGGLGFGVSAAAMICEEMGRSLVPAPVFETLAFGLFPLLAVQPFEGRDVLLASLMDGSLSASGPVVPSGLVTHAPIAEFSLVPGISDQTLLGIPCDQEANFYRSMSFISPSEKGAFELRSSNPGFDLTRASYSLSLSMDEVSRHKVALQDAARLRATQFVLAVSEMVGASRALLEMTTEYVKTRKQFGVAIGTFQAIQHKLADMVSAVESVSSLLRFASWSLDLSTPQSFQAALSLKAHASRVLPKVAEDALQIHGGIGFTYEFDLHLWLRRVASLALWFGSSSELWVELGALELKMRANADDAESKNA